LGGGVVYSQLEEKRETIRATHNRKKLLWGLLGTVCGTFLFCFFIAFIGSVRPAPISQRFFYFSIIFGIGLASLLIWLMSESATATDTELVIRLGFITRRATWDEIEDYGLDHNTLCPTIILKNGKHVRLNKTWINFSSLQNAITQRTPYSKSNGTWLLFGVRPHELPHTFAYGKMPSELNLARKNLFLGIALLILLGAIVGDSVLFGGFAGLGASIRHLYNLYKGYRETRYLPERFQVDSEGVTMLGVSHGRLYPWAEIASTQRDRDWIKVYDRLGVRLFEFSIYLPNANALLAAIQYKIDAIYTPINILQSEQTTPKK
jgi:hypothetical protein